MNATQAQEPTTTVTDSAERENLLACLAHARYFLTFTARDLTTEQASTRTTVSELTIGGLIKHVTGGERSWADFMVSGKDTEAKEYADFTEEDWFARQREFDLLPGETLEGVLADYIAEGKRTEEIVRNLPSLDVTHELPRAPWFTEKSWSARRALMHIILETSQHAGHADIIRESLDGAKSMG
ncbi:MAG TPA: DinB family protein [Candidatus Corynebacterium avicola]|uniref:DinB family protein n=1 Tax=Candidatus Corynebacterium avicola TaxID=2838527 RepID=A0A9D1UKL1_9CORY|nr:DinB family protein [Candidatus Corynebacterium avicola]